MTEPTLPFALERADGATLRAVRDAGRVLLEFEEVDDAVARSLSSAQAVQLGLWLISQDLEELVVQGETIPEELAMRLAAALLKRTAERALLEQMPPEGQA